MKCSLSFSFLLYISVCLLTERINYKLVHFFTLFYTKMLLYSLSLCLYTKNLICHLRTHYACAIIASLLSIIANALLIRSIKTKYNAYVWYVCMYECVW